jgi:quinolinate synthase
MAPTIEHLKRERNAVILVHNYEPGPVQDLGDYVGDSLELSRKAAHTDADVIVFCGVRFMAETAKILSPDKTVLLPVAQAGCPMADMISAGQVQQMRQRHPNAAVLCYVNTSAAVKAHSDVCCTSANAAEVVRRSFDPMQDVIFVPDRNLAANTARAIGREFIVWDGYCPVHDAVTVAQITAAKQRHPDALVMVHPECRPEVCACADEVVSTGGMCRIARESDAREFIVGTENGMRYRLQKENPGKRFFVVSQDMLCQDMKRISPQDVYDALVHDTHAVTLDKDISVQARRSIERMLRIS